MAALPPASPKRTPISVSPATAAIGPAPVRVLAVDALTAIREALVTLIPD